MIHLNYPKLFIVIIIVFIFTMPSSSLTGATDNPKLNSLSSIEEIENSIIIKGLESSLNNNSQYSRGIIIYDNSFNDLIIRDRKNKSLKKSNKRKVSDSTLIHKLRKKDKKWHLTPHKIKKGENLWVIAREYNIDYKLIIRVNHITKPEILNPGNIINIPNRNGIEHKVKKGESIIQISKKYKVNKSIIISNNRIRKKNLIKTGELLFIPDAVSILNENNYKKDAKSKIIKNIRKAKKQNYYAKKSVKEFKRKRFSWPLNGKITSAFGKRINPITRKSRFHCGLDISAKIGTPIKAAATGKVIFSGWKKGYGRVVILKHNNGYITVYAHNKKNIKKVGDNIKKGNIIALSGISGAVTGPHLHFEIRKYLTPLNPMRFLL